MGYRHGLVCTPSVSAPKVYRLRVESHVMAKTWIHMVVLRLFVGIAEAFVQGAILYLSFWYTYKELALRGAIFQSVSSLAGAFNGLLSYGIAKDLKDVNGWQPWQWIFLVEGVSFAHHRRLQS